MSFQSHIAPNQPISEIRRDLNKVGEQLLASSPERSQVGPSLLPSSPLLLASSDQEGVAKLKSTSRVTPTRQELAHMMGVDYNDKVQKTKLRRDVKLFVLRFIDMSKTFTE